MKNLKVTNENLNVNIILCYFYTKNDLKGNIVLNKHKKNCIDI